MKINLIIAASLACSAVLSAQGLGGGIQQPGAGGPPSGSAGGDLQGFYPNPTTKIVINAVTQFGCVGDNTTDNTTCLNNALTAAYNTHGAQIYLPAASGAYKVGCLSIPNDGVVSPGGWNMAPYYRIYGDGFNFVSTNVAQMSIPTLGTRLALNCSSTSSGGQIVATGLGFLELDHIAFTEGAGNPTTTWSAGSTLTSIVVASNVATITTSTGNGLWVGGVVQVLGSATTAINQEYDIKSLSSSTVFTVATSGVADGTYTSGASVTYTPPMIYSTNTVVLAHDNLFLGSTALGTTLNNQTAIMLGGMGNSNDTTLNSEAGGYGTVIERNTFNDVTANVWLRHLASGFQIINNFGWPFCGSSNANNGAAFIVQGGYTNTFIGNVVGGQYKWGVRVMPAVANDANGNVFINGFSDNAGQAANYRFEAGTTQNYAVSNNKQSATAVASEATPYSNTIISTATSPSTTNTPWVFPNVGVGHTPVELIDVLSSAVTANAKIRTSNTAGYGEFRAVNDTDDANHKAAVGVGGSATGDIFQNKGYLFSGLQLDGLVVAATKVTTGKIDFYAAGSSAGFLQARMDVNGLHSVAYEGLSATPGLSTTGSGCAASMGTGSTNSAGSITVTGGGAACTLTLTWQNAISQPFNFNHQANVLVTDTTTPTNLIKQAPGATTTTTAIAGPLTTGDVLVYISSGY